MKHLDSGYKSRRIKLLSIDSLEKFAFCNIFAKYYVAFCNGLMLYCSDATINGEPVENQLKYVMIQIV